MVCGTPCHLLLILTGYIIQTCTSLKTAIESKQQLQKETLDGQLLILRHLKGEGCCKTIKRKAHLW